MSRSRHTYAVESRRLQYRYDIQRYTEVGSPSEYLAIIAMDYESLAEYFTNGWTPWQEWPFWFLHYLAQLARTVGFRADLAQEGLRHAIEARRSNKNAAETRRRIKHQLGPSGPISLGVLSAVDFKRACEYVARKYDWRELRGPAPLTVAEELRRVSERPEVLAPALVAQAAQDEGEGGDNAEASTVGSSQRVARLLPYNDDVLEAVEEVVGNTAGQDDVATMPTGLSSPISASSGPESPQDGEPIAEPPTPIECIVESQTEILSESDWNDWDDSEQLRDNAGKAEAQTVTAPVADKEQEILEGIEAIDETPAGAEIEVEAEPLANVGGLAAEPIQHLMASGPAKTTAALPRDKSTGSKPLCKTSQ